MRSIQGTCTREFPLLGQSLFNLFLSIIIFNYSRICLSPLFLTIFPRKPRVAYWSCLDNRVDTLNDDYFAGTKMAMKIKHVKGIVRIYLLCCYLHRTLLLKPRLLLVSPLSARSPLISFLAITATSRSSPLKALVLSLLMLILPSLSTIPPLPFGINCVLFSSIVLWRITTKLVWWRLLWVWRSWPNPLLSMPPWMPLPRSTTLVWCMAYVLESWSHV